MRCKAYVCSDGVFILLIFVDRFMVYWIKGWVCNGGNITALHFSTGYIFLRIAQDLMEFVRVIGWIKASTLFKMILWRSSVISDFFRNVKSLQAARCYALLQVANNIYSSISGNLCPLARYSSHITILHCARIYLRGL